jgi:hypothetical protein
LIGAFEHHLTAHGDKLGREYVTIEGRMRRSLGLLASAVAVVWVWLLFDMSSTTRALDLASTAAAGGTAGSSASPALHSKPGWPTYIVARATSLFSSPPRSESVAEPAPSPPAPELTGELGPADQSPEFKSLHERYARETRDGTWAFAQEQRVRALFANHPLAAHVVLLNCQTSVCQLVLEGNAPDLVAQLWYVPNLRRETGLGPNSPYSFRGGQLSLYFERASKTSL